MSHQDLFAPGSRAHCVCLDVDFRLQSCLCREKCTNGTSKQTRFIRCYQVEMMGMRKVDDLRGLMVPSNFVVKHKRTYSTSRIKCCELF